jgi:hypothetical protein
LETRDELRANALTAFLEERAAEGFDVETRTATHAIIVRSPRRSSFLSRFRAAPAERCVVEVDEHGHVTTSPAEPLRS